MTSSLVVYDVTNDDITSLFKPFPEKYCALLDIVGTRSI